jgi:hypothetical protein
MDIINAQTNIVSGKNINDENNSIKKIKESNLKYRCICMSIMCAISLYNWFNYSLFGPIINEISYPYYQNCLLFIFYLLWDLHQITMSPYKMVLYRKDLVIHHVFSLLFVSGGISYSSLQCSHVILMECLSIMNYTWRNHKYYRHLNYYRLFCIFFIRLPICIYMMYYVNPIYFIPYYKSISYPQFLCAYYLNYSLYFYIFYDLFIIKQIYRNLIKNGK